MTYGAEVRPDVVAFFDEAKQAAGLTASLKHCYPFGDSPEMADALLDLILDGRKTATADLAMMFSYLGEPEPIVGDLAVVLDGIGRAACVIETVDVTQAAFSECSEDHARSEGEGDLSLAYWRRAHEAYYRRWLEPRGFNFSEDLIIIYERFRVVYSDPQR